MENKSLSEIEEYLKSIAKEETNLYMRCLECEEYKHISQMDIDSEICDECNKKYQSEEA